MFYICARLDVSFSTFLKIHDDDVGSLSLSKRNAHNTKNRHIFLHANTKNLHLAFIYLFGTQVMTESSNKKKHFFHID